MEKYFFVEIVYALKYKQYIKIVKIQKNSTVEEVIKASGILELPLNINLKKQKVGIFSKIVNLIDLVKNGDRIEIYRPIIVNKTNIKFNNK